MQNDMKLKQAFTVGLGLNHEVNFESLEFAKFEAWDSIAHMKLIASIEELFGIRLEVGDVLALSSFSAAKEILQKYPG